MYRYRQRRPQRLRQLPGGVGGEHDQGPLGAGDGAQLGDRHLEVRQHLQQQRLGLHLDPVDLVDQQHHRVGGPDGLQQGPGEQERLGEDVGLDLGPAGVLGPVGLDAQQLLLVVPLVQGLGLVQALVALEPDQPGPGGGGQGLGQLGLADPGRPLGQDGLLQPVGQEGDVGDHRGGQVPDLGQAPGHLVDVGEPVGHQRSSVR
jgi:hypothetical protein